MVTFAFRGGRRSLRFAVHGAALALWAAAGAGLLQSQAAPGAVLAFWVLAGAAIPWNAGRRSAGRESLTLTPTLLILRRDVGPFQLRRRFDLDRINRVRSVRMPGMFPVLRRIEFQCDGRTRRFGHGLPSPEASCIVDLLRRSTALFR